MPYIYSKAGELDGEPLVGSHQCVALIQRYTSASHASSWTQGAAVRGNLNLASGTVIATFVDGRYPNHGQGNHAAFYVGQDVNGIWVVDQWKSETKHKISRRHLSFQGKSKSGAYKNPSNNADAFSVVE